MTATAALAAVLAVPAGAQAGVAGGLRASRAAVSGPQASFNGVAVRSASDAWAVGGAGPDDGPVRTLIERWDGSTWKHVPSPDVAGSTQKHALRRRSPGAQGMGRGLVRHLQHVPDARRALERQEPAASGQLTGKIVFQLSCSRCRDDLVQYLEDCPDGRRGLVT
jgi:hypothetical protein